MPLNRNVLPEDKIKAVLDYLTGKGSQKSIAKRYRVRIAAFQKWIAKYKTFGESAFIRTGHNARYTIDFKRMVAEAYINGEGSLESIAIKYKLPTLSTVKRWVIKYNGHEEFKNSGSGGVSIMTKGRKTNYEERIDIVKFCIEHQNNFTETASEFQVSYQQVYTWVKKYEAKGVESLQDKRGRTKPEYEMSELEKLRVENKLLRAENRRKEVEIEFLKKLDEIERRRY